MIILCMLICFYNNKWKYHTWELDPSSHFGISTVPFPMPLQSRALTSWTFRDQKLHQWIESPGCQRIRTKAENIFSDIWFLFILQQFCQWQNNFLQLCLDHLPTTPLFEQFMQREWAICRKRKIVTNCYDALGTILQE